MLSPVHQRAECGCHHHQDGFLGAHQLLSQRPLWECLMGNPGGVPTSHLARESGKAFAVLQDSGGEEPPNLAGGLRDARRPARIHKLAVLPCRRPALGPIFASSDAALCVSLRLGMSPRTWTPLLRPLPLPRSVIISTVWVHSFSGCSAHGVGNVVWTRCDRGTPCCAVSRAMVLLGQL